MKNVLVPGGILDNACRKINRANNWLSGRKGFYETELSLEKALDKMRLGDNWRSDNDEFDKTIKVLEYHLVSEKGKFLPLEYNVEKHNCDDLCQAANLVSGLVDKSGKRVEVVKSELYFDPRFPARKSNLYRLDFVLSADRLTTIAEQEHNKDSVIDVAKGIIVQYETRAVYYWSV